MAVIVWSPGFQAENAVVFPPEYQDRAAWEIHRRSTRSQIEADMAEAERRLAAPEMEPYYAQIYTRPEFEERLQGVVRILRTALTHKDREEKDLRFAAIYAALEAARDAASEALEAIYDAGVSVDLTALEKAVADARAVRGGS